MSNPAAGDGSGPSPYQILRSGITDGSLTPGSPLTEQQLAEMCGVSRTPIREAVLRLEQDGLVQRTARGLVVVERSPDQILDIYDARIVLEQEVTRFAVERHTEFDRIRLNKLIRAADALSSPKTATNLAALNHRFHSAIWDASHNQALADLLGRLYMHLTRYPATTLSYERRWEEARTEHRQIVQAILDRDAEAAMRLSKEHFERAKQIRIELWRNEAL